MQHIFHTSPSDFEFIQKAVSCFTTFMITYWSTLQIYIKLQILTNIFSLNVLLNAKALVIILYSP